MKATKFSAQMQDAGIALAITGAKEPRVVVREGRDGIERFLKAVKVRNDPRKGPLIVLEWER